MSVVYIWLWFVLIVFLCLILLPHICSPTSITYFFTTVHFLKMILVWVLKCWNQSQLRLDLLRTSLVFHMFLLQIMVLKTRVEPKANVWNVNPIYDESVLLQILAYVHCIYVCTCTCTFSTQSLLLLFCTSLDLCVLKGIHCPCQCAVTLRLTNTWYWQTHDVLLTWHVVEYVPYHGQVYDCNMCEMRKEYTQDACEMCFMLINFRCPMCVCFTMLLLGTLSVFCCDNTAGEKWCWGYCSLHDCNWKHPIATKQTGGSQGEFTYIFMHIM